MSKSSASVPSTAGSTTDPWSTNEPPPREIRCVLLPIGQRRLLLPNASVVEVIALPRAEPMAGVPPWLLGRIAWRSWRVPLLSFTRLAGIDEADAELGARAVVLKALGGHPQLPFIAMLTQGFARLITLNAELIIPTYDGNALPPGARAHVLVRDEVAVIPDLEAIEAQLLEILKPDDSQVPCGEAGQLG